MPLRSKTKAVQLAMLREMVDALTAHVAVLDDTGSIVQVNDRWRRYGSQRGARCDFVGFNYLDVCSAAADRGDVLAGRVEKGLRKLLRGDIDTFGIVYHCSDRTFRLRARTIDFPVGRIIVLHEDITALLRARRERNRSRLELTDARQEHASRVAYFHEELGQRLAAISLAAKALENGGCPTTAAAIIRMSVDEAMREVRLLRYDEA